MEPKALSKAIRARAENRALLLVNLSDADARLARILFNHLADVIEGKDEPKIPVKVVKKLAVASGALVAE